MLIPDVELEALVEVLERAPPTAWRTSDRMSEGMKILRNNFGLKREYSTPKALTLQDSKQSVFLYIF